jgi:GT2 family glycosyltransferase
MLDISVIIPFKDHAEVTLQCVKSLIKFSEPVKEIILISNNSSKTELPKIKEQLAEYENAKLLIYNHPFNYHKINNFGLKYASGSVILFLNNDIELTENARGLISTMYKKALQPKVGAVGCVLLYGDGRTIQHGGVYLVPGGTADHLYTRLKFSTLKRAIESGTAPYDISDEIQLTAVTAAAVIVERRKLDEVHGMNEDFIIGGGDVDLCLRLEDAGYGTWLIGYDHGYMLHKESMSRSNLSIPYSDFCESYKIYVEHFDMKRGDRYLYWEKINNE